MINQNEFNMRLNEFEFDVDIYSTVNLQSW